MTSGQELVRSADRLRQFLQHPSRLWTIRDDPEQAILQAARTMDRDAAAYFGDAALLAAAMPESAVTAAGKVCRWCHAYQRVGQGAPMPPVNEATLRLLGSSCERCAKVNLGRVLRALDEEMAADDLNLSTGQPEPMAAAAHPGTHPRRGPVATGKVSSA